MSKQDASGRAFYKAMYGSLRDLEQKQKAAPGSVKALVGVAAERIKGTFRVIQARAYPAGAARPDGGR